ncbi:CGNR zinc finger domain-containing protein [Streptomyces sp. NPDC059740]|uniref:CGNR zinc finger domain-containing protein n=1 Tax=Streptomyces sp. NPDC059740 TaxID=3346926 RepID=UPI00365C64D7
MPLPSEIEPLHAFLNSIDLRSFTDHGTVHQGGEHLPTARALTGWLRERELLAAGTDATEADLRHAHRLRGQLRGALAQRSLTAQAAEAGPAPEQGPLVPGEEVPMTLRLTTYPGRAPALLPVAAGAQGALDRIALMVCEAVAAGTWNRLKMCEAADCRWVFYDRSRPGRGRWCAADLCGNRMKTRAYRERHR